MNKITINGKRYDFNAVVNMMDDEIREELHTLKDWGSEQDFVDAYCIAHVAKFWRRIYSGTNGNLVLY